MLCSPCWHGIVLLHTKFCWNRTVGRWVMAKKAIFKMAATAILNFKNCHMTLIRFNICCNEIGRFFTEIWRFNDFQSGGRPPSWIFKKCSFCHVDLVDMPFCFFIQNFAEIGQSVDELWPKKWFSRWRPPPSWTLKKSIFGYVATAFAIVYRISSKSDYFSLRYGDLTIFEMAAVCHLGF